MTKYRIKKVTNCVWQDPKYYIQKKFLFFWLNVNNDELTSIDEAMKLIAILKNKVEYIEVDD